MHNFLLGLAGVVIGYIAYIEGVLPREYYVIALFFAAYAVCMGLLFRR